jgi:hypothetical protein
MVSAMFPVGKAASLGATLAAGWLPAGVLADGLVAAPPHAATTMARPANAAAKRVNWLFI